MDPLIPLLLGILCVIVVNALAPKIGVAAPLILVVAGVAVSFLPFVPAIEVEPDLILVGVLPLLLYASAVNTPLIGLRRNLGAISGLSMLLVVATAVLVGFLLSRLIPNINLAAGIALAAVISPTDAVATSIVKNLGVSSRVITILEGESLLNDASALVILRSAIAAMAGAVSFGMVAIEFVWAVVGAIVIGMIIGHLSLWFRSRLHNAVLTTAASFVVPFAAYLPAEHVGASGVVAAVMAGLVVGQHAPAVLPPQDRRTEEANWATIELLLEGGIFLLMGLELYGLVEDVTNEHQSVLTAVWFGAIAFAAVLVVRALYLGPLLWGLRREADRLGERREQLESFQQQFNERSYVLPGPGEPRERRRVGFLQRLVFTLFKLDPRRRRAKTAYEPTEEEMQARIRMIEQRFISSFADIDYLAGERLGTRDGVLLVWAGMRGVITVAAAQSLPANTPNRSLLVLIAFFVAAGSLLIQGGTLPWVVRLLGPTANDNRDVTAERVRMVTRLAEVTKKIMTMPNLRRLNGKPFDESVIERATSESDRIAANIAEQDGPHGQYRELRLMIVRAQRAEVLEQRDQGTYSSETLEDALAILDSDEIGLILRDRIENDPDPE